MINKQVRYKGKVYDVNYHYDTEGCYKGSRNNKLILVYVSDENGNVEQITNEYSTQWTDKVDNRESIKTYVKRLITLYEISMKNIRDSTIIEFEAWDGNLD